MATDPQIPHAVAAEPAPASASTPIIENEFLTYRAVSRGAVFALMFGVLSISCFANPWTFAFLPILAIVTGVLADRRIQRYSDVLTGRKLAQAGIALGLIFGLMSFTLYTVQRYINTRSATQFAEKYVDILQKGTLGDMLLYGLAPQIRESTTPQKLMEQFRARSADEEQGPMLEMKQGAYTRLMNRVASGGDQHVEFVRIEKVDMVEDTPYAVALFKIHGPTSKEFPDEEQYIGAILKSQNDGSASPWWVDEIHFPYQPSSFVPAAKAADDGHGHAH